MYGFPALYKDGILGEANDEKREDWKLVRQNSEPKLKPEVTLAVNFHQLFLVFMDNLSFEKLLIGRRR